MFIEESTAQCIEVFTLVLQTCNLEIKLPKHLTRCVYLIIEKKLSSFSCWTDNFENILLLKLLVFRACFIQTQISLHTLKQPFRFNLISDLRHGRPIYIPILLLNYKNVLYMNQQNSNQYSSCRNISTYVSIIISFCQSGSGYCMCRLTGSHTSSEIQL